MKSLCINCHKHIDSAGGKLHCSAACLRQYRKLSVEDEKQAFHMWTRELRRVFDYDNEQIGEILQLKLFREQA